MIAKNVVAFLVCCWVSIIGICGVLLFLAFRPGPIEDHAFICGNSYMENSGTGNDSTFADGKAVFNSNCAACHNPIKDATGPSMKEIISFRSPEWICKFLTKPKFFPNDKRATSLRKSYHAICLKFPDLTCEQIKAAITFTDHYKY